MSHRRSLRRSQGLSDDSKPDDSRSPKKPLIAPPTPDQRLIDDSTSPSAELPTVPEPFEYKPIVIREPQLDDLHLDDPSGEDPSIEDRSGLFDDGLGEQLDGAGKVFVWQQSGSNRLIAADVTSESQPVSLKPPRGGSREMALISVESYGRGLGAIFKEGQGYLLGLYTRTGALRRTQALKSNTLEALELKHQDDLNGDGRLGPRQSRRAAADQSRGALLGEPIQPLEGFMAGSSLDPFGSVDPLAAMAMPAVVCQLPPSLI